MLEGGLSLILGFQGDLLAQKLAYLQSEAAPCSLIQTHLLEYFDNLFLNQVKIAVQKNFEIKKKILFCKNIRIELAELGEDVGDLQAQVHLELLVYFPLYGFSLNENQINRQLLLNVFKANGALLVVDLILEIQKQDNQFLDSV